MLDLLSFNPYSDQDNLTFVFGLLLLLLLGLLSAHAISRRAPSVAPTFRRIHRPLAASLLLVAAAHWWPFAIFLAPAVAIAATARAVESTKRAEGGVGDASLALAVSVAATLVGTVSVWAARAGWMQAHPSEYYTLPVNLFPPAAVGAAFVLARGAAAATLVVTRKRLPRRTLRVSREQPLLSPTTA